jgi:hypothetical protein
MTDDAIDRYVAGLAHEEPEDINRKQGQQILDMLDARNTQGVDPFLEALHQAHRAKAEEADK